MNLRTIFGDAAHGRKLGAYIKIGAGVVVVGGGLTMAFLNPAMAGLGYVTAAQGSVLIAGGVADMHLARGNDGQVAAPQPANN